MSVLELSEESRLLREAAKGWSLGNVPLSDYRVIRRATLGSMLGIHPDEEDARLGIQEEPNDVTETIEHVPPQPAQEGGGGRMMMIAVVGVIIVVGGAAALLFAS
ncbi:MAG: hypothetical protein VX766_05675 [Pseudomonadota bacterium]|nr:hypothetical protein [Pseudomonadota bacterium]